jgi:tellurite resistance protein TerC
MPLSPEAFDAVWIILSLIVIEGLLSVDNALAIAALASHLPEKQRYMALKLGLVGAYVFRGFALLIANWIIHNPWLKLAGAVYLIYLMCSHLGHTHHDDDHPDAIKLKRKPGLWMTVLQIELMDLSLSIDNVVAAVVMSPRFWVVFTGVAIGILALRFLAGYAIRLIEKYPILKDTAFVLVGYVGMLLVFELTFQTEVHAPAKFSGILLIVALTILYSRQAWLKNGLRPVLAFSRVLMRAGAGLVDLLLLPITWPFQKLVSMFHTEEPDGAN